jgi:hypothetical protein
LREAEDEVSIKKKDGELSCQTFHFEGKKAGIRVHGPARYAVTPGRQVKICRCMKHPEKLNHGGMGMGIFFELLE